MLAGRMKVEMGVQCKCKGFTISEDMKQSSFKEVSEMLNSRINC